MRRETKESQLDQLDQLDQPEPQKPDWAQAPQFQKQLIQAMSVESHKVFVSERGCCPSARDRAKIANQVYELAVECGISSIFKLDIKSDVIKTLTRLNRIKKNKNADASADCKIQVSP
jgi:hypothetical protein